MLKWSGPCWNANEQYTIWQMDSEWSEKRIDDSYQNVIHKDLKLLTYFLTDKMLLQEEYAYLAERGYLTFNGDVTTDEFRAALQIVWLRDKKITRQLTAIGDKIRTKRQEEFNKLKKSYMDAVLAVTPKQLRKMQLYGLQNIFYADGWFILHCIRTLVDSGRLALPTERQRKSLTTIITANQ